MFSGGNWGEDLGGQKASARKEGSQPGKGEKKGERSEQGKVGEDLREKKGKRR